MDRIMILDYVVDVLGYSEADFETYSFKDLKTEFIDQLDDVYAYHIGKKI